MLPHPHLTEPDIGAAAQNAEETPPIEKYTLPQVVEVARTSAITEAQAIVTSSAILAAVGAGILALQPQGSVGTRAINSAPTFFGYCGVLFNIIAAYSSVQIIAQLLCLPDEARRLCHGNSGLPARIYYHRDHIDKAVLLKATRFAMMQEFGLWRSKGKWAFNMISIMFTFSYQAGYGCLVLQLLCLAWARETKLVAAMLTPVAFLGSIPLMQDIVSNSIVGYRAAKSALRPQPAVFSGN